MRIGFIRRTWWKIRAFLDELIGFTFNVEGTPVSFRRFRGEHALSGLEYGMHEGRQSLLFSLDGCNFEAVLIDEDGDRPCIAEVHLSNLSPSHPFEELPVYGTCDEDAWVFKFVDSRDEKRVLLFGTAFDEKDRPTVVLRLGKESGIN